MDEIDQPYADANVEELGPIKAQLRGESRHVGTGVGDDDDDENTLDYV